MALKIINPFFKSDVELAAADLAPKIEAVLTANAHAIGALAGLAEIRGYLLPADAAKLTRQVFNQVCTDKGWIIANPQDQIA